MVDNVRVQTTTSDQVELSYSGNETLRVSVLRNRLVITTSRSGMNLNSILEDAGEFRTINVGVGSHIAPQAHLINTLIQNLFDWLKHSNESMLLKSCIFHYKLKSKSVKKHLNGKLFHKFLFLDFA